MTKYHKKRVCEDGEDIYERVNKKVFEGLLEWVSVSVYESALPCGGVAFERCGKVPAYVSGF